MISSVARVYTNHPLFPDRLTYIWFFTKLSVVTTGSSAGAIIAGEVEPVAGAKLDERLKTGSVVLSKLRNMRVNTSPLAIDTKFLLIPVSRVPVA